VVVGQSLQGLQYRTGEGSERGGREQREKKREANFPIGVGCSIIWGEVKRKKGGLGNVTKTHLGKKQKKQEDRVS